MHLNSKRQTSCHQIVLRVSLVALVTPYLNNAADNPSAYAPFYCSLVALITPETFNDPLIMRQIIIMVGCRFGFVIFSGFLLFSLHSKELKYDSPIIYVSSRLYNQ